VGLKEEAMTRADIDEAVAVLCEGGVVVYPTDTLYGLAADPRRPDAVARLFAVKGRPKGQAIPLIACDVAQAAAAGELNAAASRLARAFWPGPLSIVVPARDLICAEVRAGDGTIAVRVPACDAARLLARAFGFCITATSANPSGQPAGTSVATVAASVRRSVGLVLDGGETPGGAPSTLVDVRASQPRLIRPGAIAWDRVLRSLE
jgi:L-threonylcarbamoyladenylate synthase